MTQFPITYYDAELAHERTRSLTLWVTSCDGKRGSLHRSERATPGDIWPVQELVGTGYSITTAEKMARREGLLWKAGDGQLIELAPMRTHGRAV